MSIAPFCPEQESTAAEVLCEANVGIAEAPTEVLEVTTIRVLSENPLKSLRNPVICRGRRESDHGIGLCGSHYSGMLCVSFVNGRFGMPPVYGTEG
jgi:hypothetical protein